MRKNVLSLNLCFFISLLFFSCNSDDESTTNEYDASLFGEWVEYRSGYLSDYYAFYSDGTCLHGSYEWDIDWINEEDDYRWYTVDKKYLYIDGTRYEYSCDGTSLELTRKGKTKYYQEK